MADPPPLVSRRLAAAFDRAANRPRTNGAPGLETDQTSVGRVITLFEDGDVIVSYGGQTAIASPVTDEFCAVGDSVYLMADPGGKLVVLGKVK